MHKKEDKTIIENYLPISLLPIFLKFLEVNLWFSVELFFKKQLFTPSQSGFLPGDSYIVQPLSILHEIQITFDKNPTRDVRLVFLDKSKSFDKVWHDGVFMFKVLYVVPYI